MEDKLNPVIQFLNQWSNRNKSNVRFKKGTYNNKLVIEIFIKDMFVENNDNVKFSGEFYEKFENILYKVFEIENIKYNEHKNIIWFECN